MAPTLGQRLRDCAGLPAALECALAEGLEVSDARLGNIQLIDWTVGYLTLEAQRGFDEEFLQCFARVTAGDGTACGRVLRRREAVLIEDVMADRDFSPFRVAACRAGFRSVLSLPLVSTSGALVGVLSTHFDRPRPMTNPTLRALERAARTTADAIILHRVRSHIFDGQAPAALGHDVEPRAAAAMRRVQRAHGSLMTVDELLRRSWQAIHRSRELLSSSDAAALPKPAGKKSDTSETSR
ncbi:hypothetical protein AA309_25425 [Microvirga vignae]|uniref:GAF domain-containing protein n=1 Tax=Microvirga vignae TaxID=1225564 RepID=A0A0H1R640_9HYPH|nr:GAF domain-containing protein [Microvirga vignae]KLK90489.1 hypothetical protein AA309_25425 [Microvirga vignae]